MQPGVTLSFTPSELLKTGAIIKVLIANPASEIDEATSLGLEFPAPRPINALIDTGAALTLINPQLAETYKLRYSGPARISAAGRVQDCPAFVASIAFTYAELGRFEALRVVACPLYRPEIACLIGRDILRHWEFNYNGSSGLIRIRDLRL